MIEEKKGLGLFALVALAAGQVIGAGVVTLTGISIGITGHSAWLAYASAVIMGFFLIVPHLLLSSMIRVKGGSYTFVATLLGETWGGLYGMIFTMNVFATGMIGLGFGTYFVALFPGANAAMVAVITITVFYIFNVLGVNFMSRIQNVLSSVLICGLLLFVLCGIGRLQPAAFDINAPGFFAGGSKGFLAAIILLVYSCTGYSFVVAYSKEANTPKRDVPYAMLITAGLIFLFYTSVALVASGVLPLKDAAGKPLTAVAKAIMPLPLYYAFVVGGPLMAIATTLNSSFTVFSRPFHQMTDDGWFTAGLARTNKYNAPFFILTIIYIIAVTPIIAGFSIQMITANTVLIGRLGEMIAICAVFTLPGKLPLAWENRYFKNLSRPLFFALLSLSVTANILAIVLSFNNMAKTNFAVTVGLVVLFLVYAIVRERSGNVRMVKSYELQ